jgi:hypothetical protein
VKNGTIATDDGHLLRSIRHGDSLLGCASTSPGSPVGARRPVCVVVRVRGASESPSGSSLGTPRSPVNEIVRARGPPDNPPGIPGDPLGAPDDSSVIPDGPPGAPGAPLDEPEEPPCDRGEPPDDPTPGEGLAVEAEGTSEKMIVPP